MKKIIYRYTCACCFGKVENPSPGTPSDWSKITRPFFIGSVVTDLFVCGACLETGKGALLLSPDWLKSTKHVLYLEIQTILCDGRDCSQKEERVIGPPSQIRTGTPFPWATVTGGLIRKGERHYCPRCMNILEPAERPIRRDGPPCGIGGLADLGREII